LGSIEKVELPQGEAEHLSAISDPHHRIRQHPASIMRRNEPTAGQRPRQAAGQVGPVSGAPQRRHAGVIDHIAAGDFHGQVLRRRVGTSGPGVPSRLPHRDLVHQLRLDDWLIHNTLGRSLRNT
jgi:hypothetical protein